MDGACTLAKGLMMMMMIAIAVEMRWWGRKRAEADVRKAHEMRANARDEGLFKAIGQASRSGAAAYGLNMLESELGVENAMYKTQPGSLSGTGSPV